MCVFLTADAGGAAVRWGQTVSIVPAPALGTQLKLHGWLLAAVRAHVESAPLLPNLLRE